MSPRFFAALVAAILLAGTRDQELEIDDAVARTAYPGRPGKGAAFI